MHRMILPLMLLVAVACQPAERELSDTAIAEDTSVGQFQPATTTGPDVEAITAWLEQCTAAFNAGDPEGILALFSDDAVSMPPDAPPVSFGELRSLYELMFGENTVQVTTQADEVVVAGDLAVMRASYEDTITPRGEGEPTEMSGTWLIVLRKQPDGSWKVWRDMWSVVPPPPPPAM